ncbi:MAG: PAS domain S-box protein [Armatimonadetes bacterium]|nr:PAS domain S-box protein [Armatimonadota bacterium]
MLVTSQPKSTLKRITGQIKRLVAIVVLGLVLPLVVLGIFAYDESLEHDARTASLLHSMNASHEAEALVIELSLVQERADRRPPESALEERDLERERGALTERLLAVGPSVTEDTFLVDTDESAVRHQALLESLLRQFSELELATQGRRGAHISDELLASLGLSLDRHRSMLYEHSQLEAQEVSDSWRRTAMIAGPIVIGVLALGLLTYLALFRNLRRELRRDDEVRQALPTQEAWFRVLFDESPVAVCVSRDGLIRHANPAYMRLFGYDEDEVIVGQSIQDHIDPESREDIQRLMDELSEKRGVYQAIEIVAQRNDGSKVQIEVTLGTVTLPDGPAFFAFFTDLTKRKQAEAARRESEQLFTLMFDSTSDMLLLMSVQADGSLVFDVMNRAYEDYIRETYPGSDVDPIGRERKEVLASWGIPEDAIKAGSKMYDEVVAERTVKHSEITVPLAGSERCLDVSVEPILNAAGECTHVLWSGRDITERKQQQEELRRLNESLEEMIEERTAELRQSEARFRAISEASPFSVLVTDSEGAIVYANDAYHRLMGAAFEDIKGWGWADYIHSDDVDDLVSSWKNYLEVGGTFENDHRIVRPDGTVAWLYCVAAPLINQNETDGHVVMLEDITARIEAREELLRAKEEAEEANAAKDRFLSRVSHELRTPLNAILGFAQVMATDRLSSEQESSVKHILEAGDHLLSLIEEVLDIAKIETGEIEIDVREVDARVQVLECVELLSPLAKARQVTIAVAGSSDAVVPIKADPRRMTQIIFNVLSNAIKFNKLRGSVTISFEPAARNRTAVVIKDTGLGISQEKLYRVFEPFDRLGAEETDVKGTGIGLTVSASLAEAMNATIEIASTEGVGTFVTITFEAAGEIVIDDDLLAIVEPPAKSAGHDLKILLVEDNRSNYLLMKTVFKRRGSCDLRIANTAEEGLQMAKQFKPDLFLLDVNLPDSLGTELIEKILAQRSLRNTPVVIVSADANTATVAEFKDKGAYAYLTKPIDITKLLQVVDEIALERMGRTS